MRNTIFAGLGVLVLAGVLSWFVFPDNALKAYLSPAVTADSGGAENSRAGGAGNGQNAGRKPGQKDQGARGSSRGGRGPRETLVVTRPVKVAVSGDRLTSIGDGEAAASVAVVPRDSGILTEVLVNSGDRVSQGDVLARLDSESEEIARDLSRRAVEDAAIAQKRIARLVRSNAGSQADLDQANNTLARAELTLRDADLKLSRRLITAPISGTVGIVRVSPGSRVTNATEIVTIDDRTKLLINFRVPEGFASRITVGQVAETTSFAVNGAQTGVVVGVGNRVDSNSRTLPVQAEIDNADDQLRPGMAFSVLLRFEGEQLPAVDPLAVQWDSTGSFVWKIVEDKAARVSIQIVQRNTDSVLVRAELADGDLIVTEGVMSLRNGGSVRTAGGGGAGNQKRDKPSGGKPSAESTSTPATDGKESPKAKPRKSQEDKT